MSILDYKRSELSPDIWDSNNKLKPGVRSYIYKSIEGFCLEEDLKGDDKFIKRILIGSSLATYYYTDESDLDVKIVLCINEFKKQNPKFIYKSDNDILEYLTDKGREGSWLTGVIPGTLHVLDFYFISIDEFSEENIIKYDSLYSITQSKWIKEPQEIDIDSNPTFILDKAKEKASDYINTLTTDISKAKRDTIDFHILMDFLKSLDKDELKKYYSEIEKSLNSINDSIEQLMIDRDVIKDLRKQSFNKKELDSQLEELMGSLNYSDGNLIFKVLQRYGYLRILTELKRLFRDKRITFDEIDDVANILNKV